MLFIFILLTSCNSVKTITDLKEYGFKGKVKNIVVLNYRDLEKKNELWVIKEDKLFSKKTMKFNKKGNIVEIHYHSTSKNLSDEIITSIEFKNGKKSKTTSRDLLGEIINTGYYTWIDKYNYSYDLVNKQKELILKSHTKLNNNFREISTEYSYIENDSIVFSESTVTELDINEEVVSTKFKDKISQEEYVIEYIVKKDKKDNLIKCAFIFRESKKLQLLSINKFEYYE